MLLKLIIIYRLLLSDSGSFRADVRSWEGGKAVLGNCCWLLLLLLGPGFVRNCLEILEA